MTILVATTDIFCLICATAIDAPGFCRGCQGDLDAKAEAERAAQARALVTDVIAEALRAHLTILDQSELIAAEHRAQIRIANAGRGVMEIKRLVDLGSLPQSSLDAAEDELEAARRVCGLVHEQQQINVVADQVEEARYLAAECAACGPEGSTGPVCDECVVDDDEPVEVTV